MKVIIIEDEIPAMARMRKLISEAGFPLEVLAECDTGEQAISDIDQLKPDVIFLDIELLDMTGFEVLSKISFKPLVIFTTAYHEYALKAFEHFSVDYLTKPISQDRFNTAIQKLVAMKSYQNNTSFAEMQEWISNQKSQKNKAFAIKLKDKIILVDHEDICFFRADDKYVNVHLKNGKSYLINFTISQLADELPEDFLRIHRSSIANKTHVVQLKKFFKGRYLLSFSDAEESSLFSSSTYKDAVKEAFDL